MAVSSVLEDNDKVDASPQLPKIQPPTTRKRSIDDTEDAEVSFILNIFPDGYSIRNPSEICFGNDQNCLPKYLRPYDRTSESLFAEAELLKALQQKLRLDPTPNLDRLCKELISLNLNLNIHDIRRKRSRQMYVPEKSNLRVAESKSICNNLI